MSKNLTFEEEGRGLLHEGVKDLARAVRSTLGPSGRNVIIQHPDGRSTVTKDGATVAEAYDDGAGVKNIGATMVKDVAQKTADMAGDGTTTATILAEAIFDMGMQKIKGHSDTVSVTQMKNGINDAVKWVVRHIEGQSEMIDPKSDKLVSIGTISANNNAELGQLTADAIRQSGHASAVQLLRSQSQKTELFIKEGLSWNQGYVSPYFSTNTATFIAELSNAHVLIIDGLLSEGKKLAAVMEACAQAGKPLLIITEDLIGEALSMAVANRVKANYPILVVKSPGFGGIKTEYLEDIQAIVGGKVFGDKQGENLGDTIDLEDLGTCSFVRADNRETRIIGKGEDPERIAAVEKRIERLKSIMAEDKMANTDDLKIRINKLSSGIAEIHIAAQSDVEFNEIRDRVEDAVFAVSAALEEGIVAGAGSAYLHSLEVFEDYGASDCSDDYNIGVEIIKAAIQQPAFWVATNCGSDGKEVIDQVRKSENKDYGFNGHSKEVVNLKEFGVVDPTKVARVALQNAASVAGTLLTTDCIISLTDEIFNALHGVR